MTAITKCPLCQRIHEAVQGFESFSFTCRVCGRFSITRTAFMEMDSAGDDLKWLSCACRQRSDIDRAVAITSHNWRDLVEDHRSTSVFANREKLLKYFLRKTARPGDVVVVRMEDWPVLDASGLEEFNWYLELLDREGYIEKVVETTDYIRYVLTYRAWEYLTGPSSMLAVTGRAFVAMSFSVDHEAIYRQGIKVALDDAGYEAVCLKDVLTNDNINDRILLEIRKAEIVIADFTGQKAGVYFEAGFAMALKKEVYWTCSKAEVDRLHFDINHYQHVIWETPEELRILLSEKVQAISGPGPGKRNPRRS